MISKKLFLSLFAFTFLFISKSIAQETTATLSGLVNDDKGNPISGATISVLHEPTGAKAASQTNKKGLFVSCLYQSFYGWNNDSQHSPPRVASF